MRRDFDLTRTDNAGQTGVFGDPSCAIRPGCAVIEAVENNLIAPERYDSYLRILDTIEDDLNF